MIVFKEKSCKKQVKKENRVYKHLRRSMKYQKSSHATYDVRYHVVWITKYRNPVLSKEMQVRLDFLIRKIGEKL